MQNIFAAMNKKQRTKFA